MCHTTSWSLLFFGLTKPLIVLCTLQGHLFKEALEYAFVRQLVGVSNICGSFQLYSVVPMGGNPSKSKKIGASGSTYSTRSVVNMAELFAGAKLLKNGGGEATGAVLEGKVVGIYFSAHWCPPCRGFTPVLKDFHAELEDGGEFEVVYVSLDRSEEDLQNYLKESHGPWYYLALNDPLVKELPTKFGVSGIPMLVIVKPNGEVVTKNGRADVQGKPPAQALAAWKSA